MIVFPNPSILKVNSSKWKNILERIQNVFRAKSEHKPNRFVWFSNLASLDLIRLNVLVLLDRRFFPWGLEIISSDWYAFAMFTLLVFSFQILWQDSKNFIIHSDHPCYSKNAEFYLFCLDNFDSLCRCSP